MADTAGTVPAGGGGIMGQSASLAFAAYRGTPTGVDTSTAGTAVPVGVVPIGGGTTGGISGNVVDIALLRFLESNDATAKGPSAI